MTKLYVRAQTWFAGLRDGEEGATAVEYALMIALIAAVIIVAVTMLGNAVNDKYNQVGSAVQNAGN